MELDANPFTKPTNMDQLKKYHVWGGSHKTPHLKWLLIMLFPFLGYVIKKKKKKKFVRLKTQKGGLGKN